MSDLEESCLPAVVVEPQQGTATASVIWLHGLGADGHDFESVALEFSRVLPMPIRFILPHAPHRPVTINNGYSMPAWFDMLDLGSPRKVNWKDVEVSQGQINALIERELSRGIASENIILAGFSQGGAIALHTGLRHPKKLGGILALSTYYLTNDEDDDLSNDPLSESNRDIPVFMAHGTHDPVIPIALAERSRDWLIENKYPVEWSSYPMPHAVCPDEIQAIAMWLVARLNTAKK